MISKSYKAVRITTNGSFVFLDQQAYVYSILIACAAEGSAWTLRIQNAEGPAVTLIPAYTLELQPTDPAHPPNPRSFEWVSPKLMRKGITIVTAGTTPGVVCVWINYSTTEDST